MKRILKEIGKIIVNTMLLLIMIITFISTVSFSKQQVSISLLPTPKVDIVVTKSRSTTDINNFKEDILEELRAKGVNTNDIEISTVEGQNVNIQEAFTWQKDVSSSIGNITITSGGKDVKMVGNQSKPGKNAIWIMPEQGQEQEFNFGYNIDFGDSFKAAGMLLRVEEIENTLRGYALSFNKSGKDYYTTSSSNAAIWEFEYVKGTNNEAMTKTLKKSLNINTSGALYVKVTDTEIIIEGGGIDKTTYLIENPYGNGFGFFSDHYSHNCSSHGAFSLTNINLQTTIVKKYSSVLRMPEWRQNAIKVLVSLQDYQNDELNDEPSVSELVTRLLNESIYFAAWGTDRNQEQLQSLIQSNNNNGIFINNTDYNDSIARTADYIKELIDKIEKPTEYVILGDPLNIKIDPIEAMNDTANSEYPYGKWKIIHDYEYYENNIGQFSESGKYIEDFITVFNKTGKYSILYEDQITEPENIYVHRRPVAEISLSISGNDVILNSDSYDLDYYSKEDKGITEEEWKYKKSNDDNWTEGKLTQVTGTDSYIVQLRVKDYQDTWSYPVSKYITNSENALPVAAFNLKNDTITKYDDLEIVDSSYDPAGGLIQTYYWEIYKGSTKIYEGETPPKSYREHGIGIYNIYLTVTNEKGTVSERFGRIFEVKEDEIPPEVIVTPLQSDWSDEVTIHLEFQDQGGSEFKYYQYAITDSQQTPTKWSDEITKQMDDVIIEQEGIRYLHIKAQDNAGNISNERVVGPYKIDRSIPNITYTGEFSETQMDYVDIDIQATDELSGVKSITINGTEIQNGTHRITKNGIYTIIATDNLNHTKTVSIEISNIYYECQASIEHPIYSSSHEMCPICGAYQGLNITENSHVYNAKEQKVIYDNPKKANIVEYYNGTKKRPKEVGNYHYELKVVYEGKEYKTGYIGNYEITKKEITIEDIVAQDKIYDGNTKVILEGGRLVGVCKDDKVQFILPHIGAIEEKNVGTWKVKINTITLTGEQAQNYSLNQPQYGTVQATVSRKTLKIIHLSGKNKVYDENATVEIIGGELEGLIEHDDVTYVIPKQGQAENSHVGTWNVAIEEIQINGLDAINYQFIQPTAEEIKVVISKEVGKLEIGCNGKKYDRNPVKPYVIKKNTTSEVEYHFYKVGSDEEIEEPFDIGMYDVIAYAPTDGNYTEVYSNKKTFIITKPDEPLLKLSVQINENNMKEETQQEIKERAQQEGKEDINVHYNDIIKMQFVVENLGKGSGYAQRIVHQLPEGLVFLPENEVNIQNGWKETQKGTLETTKLSLENNIENEIFPQKDMEDDKIQSKTIELVVKVISEKKEETILESSTNLEQQDKRGETIDYTKQNETYAQQQTKMRLNYLDLEVKNRITSIIQKDLQNKKQTRHIIKLKDNKMVKVEVASGRTEYTQLIINYEIEIKNLGNEAGKIEKIINILPQGTKLEASKNQGWKIEDAEAIVYELNQELQPNETKKIPVQLTMPTKGNLAKLKDNQVIIQSSSEIDQIFIEEEKIELKQTNNYASSKMIVSVSTGKVIIGGTILTIIVLSILTLGIWGIKEFVLK